MGLLLKNFQSCVVLPAGQLVVLVKIDSRTSLIKNPGIFYRIFLFIQYNKLFKFILDVQKIGIIVYKFVYEFFSEDMRRETRESIGRKVKSLLNWGRIKYLDSMGFDSKLYYYTRLEVSLENMCVVATRKIKI